MKILFIVPYPIGKSPSQRFRFEQYFEALSRQGWTYHVQSFLNARDWEILYKPGQPVSKLLMIVKGFSKRFFILFTATSYDYIFIHRESAPIGPPFFEWFLAKVLNRKIIYDFDDAIWMTDKAKETFANAIVRWRKKVNFICSVSYKVSCGNEFLCQYARQFNNQVVLNPTTVDTDTVHNPELVQKQSSNKLTIGWTGSHSTLKYLNALENVFNYLEKKYPDLQVLIIADKKPELKINSLNFIPWNEETEASDLAKIDIGVMPLPDDEWTKGKCGFKAIQYMALKIPAVVSPVGVNNTLVDAGVNGYFATTEDEWINSLELLIHDADQRKAFGERGRKKIVRHYSVVSNTGNFLSLFS